MSRPKGFKMSETHKQNISKARKGQQNTLGKHWKRDDMPWNKGLKGIHQSPRTEFKKGIVPWNKGLEGYKMGEKHYNWKGGDGGYGKLHYWVYQKKGRPTVCEFCGTTKGKLEWANKSQQYRKELNDWLSLCKKCHVEYDNTIKVLKSFAQDSLTIKYICKNFPEFKEFFNYGFPQKRQ